MLAQTRKIEKDMVGKLHSMYFAAKKVSMPSIKFMQKKEQDLIQNGEDPQSMYLECSKKLNQLINLYFSAGKDGK